MRAPARTQRAPSNSEISMSKKQVDLDVPAATWMCVIQGVLHITFDTSTHSSIASYSTVRAHSHAHSHTDFEHDHKEHAELIAKQAFAQKERGDLTHYRQCAEQIKKVHLPRLSIYSAARAAPPTLCSRSECCMPTVAHRLQHCAPSYSVLNNRIRRH